MIYYSSTRGSGHKITFSEAILQGQASDGGLFVPERVPILSREELGQLSGVSYQEIAELLFCKFETDFTKKQIQEIVGSAYNNQNFDHPNIAPVIRLEDKVYLLELWHGPTAAFKDMALQIMPLFFSQAMEKKAQTKNGPLKYKILVATSGDTGKAALEGYKNRKNIEMIVFYPHDGVSDLQQRQMATQDGNNVTVYGVRGNFDDIQRAVKEVFSDVEFQKILKEKQSVILSSANSINWGRLLPQIVYYFFAYTQLIHDGEIQSGDVIDVVVPTGNFGNILAAFYAHKMGLPIAKFICASNQNNVLTDFFQTGKYDISGRNFVKTPSPSMDILIASNVERFLYELTGDVAKVTKWMQELQEKKCFKVDKNTQAQMRKLFYATSTNNEDTLRTIQATWKKNGHLVDPHTAVGIFASRIYQIATNSSRPIVTVVTAHWSKFAEDVYKALKKIPFHKNYIPELEGLSGVQTLHKVLALSPGEKIPTNIACLDEKEVRFTQILSGDSMSVREVVGK